MRGLWIACVLAIACLPARGEAHGLRSAYVEVHETEPGHALVHLRMSTPGGELALHAEPACTLDERDGAGDGLDRAWLLACPGGFAGRTLAIDGLGPVIGEVVAYVALASGTGATHVVRAAEPSLPLAPARPPSASAVAREFVGLGLLHIVTGYDHLLFLLLVVLLMRDVRGVLLAETAFTLSHSLSFTATALGWIHVSSAAAETCIALSLLMLAADIQLARPAPARWPGAAIAFVFGAVHGLGFAGGLREIGLPEHAIGSALLGFAAGIELGQIAFLAIVLGILYAVRRWAHLPRAQLAAVYAIGSLSACWVFQRALAL